MLSFRAIGVLLAVWAAWCLGSAASTSWESAPNSMASVAGSASAAKFDPYADNGGTVVALAGEDFCLIAADSRLSDAYCIRSRQASRLTELCDRMCFVGSGCWADIRELAQSLTADIDRYEWENDLPMPTLALAHFLSDKLYRRRFFPYFSFCTLAGLDDEGHGAVFKFDAVGSFERVLATCSGRGEALIQPMLDEATAVERDDEIWTLGEGDVSFRSARKTVKLTMPRACDLVLRAFRAASEREISIGDSLDMWIITRSAEEDERSPSTPDESASRRSAKWLKNSRIIKKSYALPRH